MINILQNKIAWFGKQSGYECLSEYLPQLSPHIHITQPINTLYSRIQGKIAGYRWGIKEGNSVLINAYRKFKSAAQKSNVNHIFYLEEYISYVKKPFAHNLIGTIHLPYTMWSPSLLQNLRHLDKPIVLYEKEIDFFQSHCSHPVRFIRHGINTDFFTPVLTKLESVQLLFAGHYLRNFAMLKRVILKVKKTSWGKNVIFNLLVPEIFRSSFIELKEVAVLDGVFFHSGLSDEQLLQLYQQSKILFLPMNDSGANTAIIQALSCGLPIVTTDVGGIRSYGGHSLFPVVENDRDDDAVELIHRLLHDSSWYNQISTTTRKWAVDNLSWDKIAKEHYALYNA